MAEQAQQAMPPAKRIVLAAMRIIYDPEVSKQLLDIMEQGETVNGTARAALIVLGQLRERAQNAPPGLVESSAPAVLGFLFELAVAAGLIETLDAQTFGQALQLVQQNLGAQEQGAEPQGGAEMAGGGEMPQGQPRGMIGQMMGAQ